MSPWYASPRARNWWWPDSPRLTQYWKAILRACSTATAPSEANSTWASVMGTAATRASANSTAARLPLPNRVAWATFPNCSTMASSSSGTW